MNFLTELPEALTTVHEFVKRHDVMSFEARFSGNAWITVKASVAGRLIEGSGHNIDAACKSFSVAALNYGAELREAEKEQQQALSDKAMRLGVLKDQQGEIKMLGAHPLESLAAQAE